MHKEKTVWEPLYERFHIYINFAWKTFKWNSESKEQAAVHYVIIGFSNKELNQKKHLFLSDKVIREAQNISPYLINEPMKRVEACKEDRLIGAPDRQKLAEIYTIFRETKNPKKYIIVSRVLSENSRYISMQFLKDEVVPTDLATII